MVGIALLTLVPGELGGSEWATRGLLEALGRVGTLPYRVYLPPVAPDAHGGLPYEVVGAYRAARTMPERVAAMTLAALRPQPLRTRLRSADVLHYPLTVRLPRLATPTVVTLHDVQHLDLPHFFSAATRAFRRIAYHGSARSADRVVCPSSFVRDRAHERLGLPLERMRVIPHGIDHERFSPGAGPPSREPFLLYPARRWPHKNHETLFAALALLRAERPELRLVLTGGGHDGPLPAGVEARGLVPLDELVSLYRRASALVFPSLYEGFGQPVLEAMACGCPVACSDIPALAEVAGGAARTFDPQDAHAVATAVRDVLDDAGRYAALGVERAAAFTWEGAAAQHEDVYRELL